MELKEYLSIFKRYLRLLLAVSVIFGIAGFIFSQFLPIKYRASTTLFVKREVEAPNPNYFTYEGYHAQMTAQKYADTVLGFLESEDIVKRALEVMSLAPTQKMIGEISAAIFAKKTAPQLVFLTVTRKEATESARLASALVQATKERSDLLNEKGDTALSIDTLNPEPIVKMQKPHPKLNALVSALTGFLLSTVAVFVWEYLRED